MGSRRVLLVFWKAKETGIQGCKKVSSMNSHSSNLCAPLLGQRFHSGGPCVFIVKRFNDQLSFHFFKAFIPLSSSLYHSVPHCFYPFSPLFLPECGGAHGGCCLITHEHHQLKWSSENDVNRWHLRKCQWVFGGSNNGRERPIIAEHFYCVNVSPIPMLLPSEDLNFILLGTLIRPHSTGTEWYQERCWFRNDVKRLCKTMSAISPRWNANYINVQNASKCFYILLCVLIINCGQTLSSSIRHLLIIVSYNILMSTPLHLNYRIIFTSAEMNSPLSVHQF